MWALLVGMPVILVNLLLQSVLSYWILSSYFQRANGVISFMRGVWQLFGVMIVLMLGTFLQIVCWGGLFLWLGEFQSLDQAVYHSGVNFATLGYGDVIMSSEWKMLGPLEAVNGSLMIGLSGATLLAALQHRLKNHFANSR